MKLEIAQANKDGFITFELTDGTVCIEINRLAYKYYQTAILSGHEPNNVARFNTLMTEAFLAIFDVLLDNNTRKDLLRSTLDTDDQLLLNVFNNAKERLVLLANTRYITKISKA